MNYFNSLIFICIFVSFSSSYAAPPTSAAFIKTLIPTNLISSDFIHPVLKVSGIEREFFPTIAGFGKSVVLKHQGVT
jgi:hypothetical protein